MKNTNKNGVSLIVLIIITIVLLILIAGVIMIFSNPRTSLSNSITEDVMPNISQENKNQSSNTTSNELSKLKAGDYIKYDSGTNGVILCRVLYPIDSEYGLQIISNESVKKITLGAEKNPQLAKTSYNDAIKILNNEALNYLNTTYALDARCVGSNPKNKLEEGKSTTTLNFSYNGNTSIDCNYTDKNYESDLNALKAANIQKISNNYYWLASRITTGDKIQSFSIRAIDISGNLTAAGPLYGVTYENKESGTTYTCGFRPCITLKTNLQISTGNGSQNNPYILSI